MIKTMKPVFFNVTRALPGCLLLAAMAIGGVGLARAEGVVDGAKEAGHAVGTGLREAGVAGKEIGLNIGHAAAEAGKEIGRTAVKVGKAIGTAAKEGSKALVQGIKGEPS